MKNDMVEQTISEYKNYESKVQKVFPNRAALMSMSSIPLSKLAYLLCLTIVIVYTLNASGEFSIKLWFSTKRGNLQSDTG